MPPPEILMHPEAYVQGIRRILSCVLRLQAGADINKVTTGGKPDLLFVASEPMAVQPLLLPWMAHPTFQFADHLNIHFRSDRCERAPNAFNALCASRLPTLECQSLGGRRSCTGHPCQSVLLAGAGSRFLLLRCRPAPASDLQLGS